MMHRLRGKASNRKIALNVRQIAVRWCALSHRDFGPTLALTQNQLLTERISRREGDYIRIGVTGHRSLPDEAATKALGRKSVSARSAS